MEKHVNILKKNFVSGVELTYKAKVKASLRPSINNSEDTYNILLGIWDMAKIELLEQFYVLYLIQTIKSLLPRSYQQVASRNVLQTHV